MSVYRGEQCPKRGPGLSHVQNGSPRCIHCGAATHNDPPPGVPNGATEAIPPPIDVTARLRSLGFDPDHIAADTDDEPREPTFITGKGPQGRPDGKGRGDLTFRQMARLKAWKGWITRLGGDDGPDPL